MRGPTSGAVPVVATATNLLLARARDRMPPDRLEAVQSRLLRGLVRHAYANVPYYRDTLDAPAVARLSTARDLAGLPVLDRRMLNEVGPEALLADGFTVEDAPASHTSGSSGVPVTVHHSRRDLNYLRATYLWDLLACGLRPFDRIGYFRVGGFRRHRLERLGVLPNIHVNTGLGLDGQVAAFLAGRPTFLWGFPNAIVALVFELQRRGIDYPAVRTVVFAGEGLAAAARASVLRFFGARGQEVYSCVEASTIARSCPHGALHLCPGVVVEVEHEDGSVSVAGGASGIKGDIEGEILVTRLHAEAMPLLRYRLGDRVRITPDDCPCPVARTPIVRKILGRVEDRLRTRDGRERNADHLASLLGHVPGIRQYQFVQHRPGTVEVAVAPADGAPADLLALVESALAPAGGEFTVAVRAAESIPAEPNGKIRLVKSHPVST